MRYLFYDNNIFKLKAMPLINCFTVFGLIFLCINLYKIKHMRRVAKNPDCAQEVRDVKLNFFWSRILPPIDIALILIGIIWWWISNGPIFG